MDTRYTVRIDSDLKALIPGYLDNRHRDVTRLNELLTNRDFKTIALIGHTMKGNGASYGLDKISEFGLQIESAARQEQPEIIKELVAGLSHYVNHLDIEYA